MVIEVASEDNTRLSSFVINWFQGSEICQIWCTLRQNCSDDSTEVTKGHFDSRNIRNMAAV